MKRNQDSAAKEAKKAGVGKAQHQKQEDEGKQHPDDPVHLVDGQGELIVELFFRVDEIRVVVVQQFLFSGFTLGFGGLCSFSSWASRWASRASRRASSSSRVGVVFSSIGLFSVLFFLIIA